MQIVSNKYKEYLNNSLSISPKSKIVVDDIEYLGDVIKTSPKFSHSNSTFIGGFPAKTVSFDIYNLNNDLDFNNKEIKVYKGIMIDGIVEWVMQGIFIAQSKDITNNISTKTMSISKAQDKTQLFDSKYESVLNWENGQTHTGLEIVQEVCTKLGITLETTNFSWANYNFKKPNFVEDITYREVISRIAQIGGEIAFLNNSGSLVIKNQMVTGDKIERKRYKTLSKEKIHTINTVVLGKEGINDDIKYPETITTDRVEFKINDNPFVDLYREEMISAVAKYIIGKSYTPFALEDFIDGFIYELNDVVTIIDKNGEEFDAVVLDYSSSSRIKANIKAETPDKNNTDYKLAGSSKEEIRKVKLDVDHINQRIEAVASDIDNNSEKINQLEITSESTISKISNVEKNLDTTNSNVKSLQTQINGVSADFEDFKDNEYVQGIDNLQKQIDGAIQFWNGAEIPTVSNYPANEWTTENDKINHQADIYTVVQDVEGEMKQGKSYRFDKINGVWQWIELTDNELSAVQAIAQEALNKANTNTSDISSLKSSVSKLEQTDKSIKASVETINNQIIPTSQVSSSNISIEDSAEAPLINFEIEGKSIQEISDQPSEIKSVGYENLANTNKRNGIYNATTGVFSDNNNYLANVDIVSVKPNTNYIFNSNLDYLFEAYLYDSNKNYIGRAFAENNKFTTTSETYYINWRTLTSGQSDLNCEVLLTEGTKQHSYIPQGKYGIEVEITNETDNYTLLFILEQPLRSLPNGVRDLAYIKNNTLYVDRKIGKHIFKEVSTLSLHSNGLYYGTNALSTLGINTTDILSDKILGGYYEENKGYVVGNGTTFVIFGNSSETIESFNDKYVGAEIYYPIAEPYIETIGELEMPSTFKGVSNITTTDELEPVINIEYVRDTTLSGYVEGQLQNERVIREESIAQLIIEDNEIKESVSSVSTDLASANTTINKVEETLTSQEKTIQIISTNIDQTTGAVKEVTTTNGFTFNHKGLKIYTDENSYNTQIDNVGTYYKDGDEVIGQTTKDGSLLKNLNLQGQNQYSYDNINEIYDFVEERIEVDGEYAYATFYNGEE